MTVGAIFDLSVKMRRVRKDAAGAKRSMEFLPEGGL